VSNTCHHKTCDECANEVYNEEKTGAAWHVTSVHTLIQANKVKLAATSSGARFSKKEVLRIVIDLVCES
jgi:hypothetical protein